MRKSSLLAILAALLISQGAARAADFSDPTWPCIQRKVESLSLGIMWPHPVPEDLSLEAPAAELAETLALRRVALEETGPLIGAFIEAEGQADIETFGRIFADVFDRINSSRTRIIDGIGDYSLKQIALADKIEATRQEMTTLMAAAEPDFDRVDALEEQLDWDERIFRDRAKSLTYVCETPVLLEKRIYAIGQTFLSHLN